MSDDGSRDKKGRARQVALSQLWEGLPISGRQQAARIVAQMIASQTLLLPEEVSDEA